MDHPPHREVELLYEIALNIGDSLDLQSMLHTAISTMLRLLNCRGAQVWQAVKQDSALHWRAVYTVPHPLANQAAHRAFLDSVSFPLAVDDWHDWQAHGSRTQTTDQTVHYLFPMPAFGALLLEKSAPPFEPTLVQPFQMIVNKLAQSAQACVSAQALQAAYVHNALQAQILDNVSEAVVATDLNEHIIYWGQGAEKMYGYQAAEVLGKPYHQFAGSVQRQDEHGLKQTLLDKGYWQGEHQQRRRDGTLFWSDVHISVLKDVDGNPNGFIGIDHDITPRKEAEEELQRMQHLNALSTVAGGIAHDFNNLLMVIFGNVELARELCARDAESVNTLNEALKATESARHLTQQLLTFAKGGTTTMETILLPPYIEDLAHFNLHGSATRVEFHWAHDLSPVYADKGLLSQVFANLVINASQAMPNGGTLKISGANDTDPPADIANKASDWVRLAFSDEGCGISAADLKHIFDPYYSTKASGKGLGLAIVQKIMTTHGGAIKAESTVGRGTTFTLWLPAGTASTATPPSEIATAADTKPASLRILYMDDEPSIRKMAARLLERLGHTVTVTADGDEVVNQYAEALRKGTPPDVVMLDLTVRGGKGGKQALEEIRQLDPQARIIVCSGYTDDAILADRDQHSIAGSIAKPFLSKDLAQELARVMQTT